MTTKKAKVTVLLEIHRRTNLHICIYIFLRKTAGITVIKVYALNLAHSPYPCSITLFVFDGVVGNWLYRKVNSPFAKLGPAADINPLYLRNMGHGKSFLKGSFEKPFVGKY